jgi:Ca2+-binding EF-hand superfamily protein
MRKVVWTSILAAAALSIAAGDALAQTQPPTARQQLRPRVERRVEKRFKRLDQNGNGAIDRSEWRRKAKAFDRFDADHDGSLSPEEFRRMAARRLGKR